jgi:hypothetical protein
MKWALRMAEKTNNLSRDIEAALKMLIRGLTQGSVAEMHAGHRALFRIGRPAIPQIREAILRSNWSRIKHGNQIRYVSGLVGLLHDIDEAESRCIVSQLKRDGCDVTIAHILDSICSFTIADYAQYHVRGVTVFEHKKLITKQVVQEALAHWLRNIPTNDLETRLNGFMFLGGRTRRRSEPTRRFCNISTLCGITPIQNSTLYLG